MKYKNVMTTKQIIQNSVLNQTYQIIQFLIFSILGINWILKIIVILLFNIKFVAIYYITI